MKTKFRLVLIVFLSVVEALLIGMFFFAPALVDTQEHKKNVYDLLRGTNQNATQNYQTSLKTNQGYASQGKKIMLIAIMVNGVIIILICKSVKGTPIKAGLLGK